MASRRCRPGRRTRARRPPARATTERPSPELEADVRVFAGPVGIAWMVTTEWDIRNAVLRSFGAELTIRASSDLAARAPDDSASRVVTRPQVVVLLACLAALVAVGIVAPLHDAEQHLPRAQHRRRGQRRLQGAGDRGRLRPARAPRRGRGARRARQRAAALHRAGARVRRGERDRRPGRAPRPPRLPARPARGAAAARGGRPADDRGRHGIGPARRSCASCVVPDGQPRTKPKACNVGPQLRARRVPRHLRRRGPARARTSCARPSRRSAPHRPR